jgi:hypothetical protein
MASDQTPTPVTQNLPQPAAPSVVERGFAPAGSAQQGINVQFTPAGQVAPLVPSNGASGKGATK